MTYKEVIKDIKWRIKSHKEFIKFNEEELQKDLRDPDDIKTLENNVFIRLIMIHQLEILLYSYENE